MELINNLYLLHKFPGKGGWTYAALPEIKPDPHAHFGWVRVRGTIDGFELKGYHLMPMGNGQLFLPVRAEIRKKIGKQAGDTVHVVLYKDDSPVDIPEEFMTCLEDAPAELTRFRDLSPGEQKAILDWIYGAGREKTRIDRIAAAINQLETGQNPLVRKQLSP